MLTILLIRAFLPISFRLTMSKHVACTKLKGSGTCVALARDSPSGLVDVIARSFEAAAGGICRPEPLLPGAVGSGLVFVVFGCLYYMISQCVQSRLIERL